VHDPFDEEQMAELEWTIAAHSRMQQHTEDAALEYPALLATCPRGHVRALPTRFSRREFPLRCHECRRDYVFRDTRA
jgi:hypothetical protein